MTNGFLCVRIIKRQSEKEYLAELCSGSTADSDSVCLGSNPYSPAKEKQTIIRWSVFFLLAAEPAASNTVLRSLRRMGSITPPVDRQARLSGAGREYPRHRRVS